MKENKRGLALMTSAVMLALMVSGCDKISSDKVDLMDNSLSSHNDSSHDDSSTGKTTTKNDSENKKNENTSQTSQITTQAAADTAVTSENVNGSTDLVQTQQNKPASDNNGTQPPADINHQESEWWQEAEPEATYIGGILIANKTYALPPTYDPGCLSEDTNEAFLKMQEDARALGLNLQNNSGYRSYADQKRIYEGYVALDGKEVADTYSARPGHSEHQTGLALDLNSINDSFADTAEGKWVAENCYKYGFIIRYPKSKETVTGYKYEPWHIRYLGVDTATAVYNSGLCLEEYLGITSQYSD
ncbi:MAG: D-alanyl-D-alanine carboxypeptidase family protein [Oscillospiraceae bacterium]|nr:D-alanyl-D-alanine carboxypeptidase family protein [Oscillospiraceae bacterium]